MTIDDGGRSPRKRAGSRLNFFLTATIASDGRADLVARVRNLSAGGMMIEADDPPPAGTPAIAQVRGIGAIAGRIVWVREHRAGMAFDRPVDPDRARKPVSGGRGR
jgi:hypothetical protein